MKCPYCGDLNNEVMETRDSEDLSATRRRRACQKCQKRFTTYERAENIDLIVIKKDSKREKFDREKVRSGILKACEKRPVTKEQIESAVSYIEEKLKQQGSEVKSRFIGELVMRKLKQLDTVAYIRFASVYREFKDVEDFKKEIKEVIN